MPTKEERRAKARAGNKAKQIQHYQDLDTRLGKQIEAQAKKKERLEARIKVEDARRKALEDKRTEIAEEIEALNKEE